MACFYFRLKTDKKPNGMRISSASHVSYVNREGRFRNIDNVQEMGANKSYKNFLSGDHPIMKLPEKPMLLSFRKDQARRDGRACQPSCFHRDYGDRARDGAENLRR